MIKLIKRTLLNDKGAMENILVTLLFVIIGVGALMGLNYWYTNEKDQVKNAASKKMTTVTTEISK